MDLGIVPERASRSPSPAPVDWSRPIEAVHEDGTRVEPALVVEISRGMDSSIFVNSYRTRVTFADLQDWAADHGGLRLVRAWRIRNVASATAERNPTGGGAATVCAD